jgi:hypothetical protein
VARVTVCCPCCGAHAGALHVAHRVGAFCLRAALLTCCIGCVIAWSARGCGARSTCPARPTLSLLCGAACSPAHTASSITDVATTRHFCCMLHSAGRVVAFVALAVLPCVALRPPAGGARAILLCTRVPWLPVRPIGGSAQQAHKCAPHSRPRGHLTAACVSGRMCWAPTRATALDGLRLSACVCSLLPPAVMLCVIIPSLRGSCVRMFVCAHIGARVVRVLAGSFAAACVCVPTTCWLWACV